MEDFPRRVLVSLGLCMALLSSLASSHMNTAPLPVQAPVPRLQDKARETDIEPPSHHKASPCMITVISGDNVYFDSGDARPVLQYGIGSQTVYSYLHNYSLSLVGTAPPGPELFIKRLDWGRHYAARRLLNGLDCSWLMVTEGDVIITNLTVKIEDIISEAHQVYQGVGPSLILNRDAAKNINTGTFFIRNSELGRQIMDRISVIRHQYVADLKLKNWASNGAMMIALRDQFIREAAVILPSIRFNSYEIEWKPGHFARHFAGFQKKGQAMMKFVREYPPQTWPGWNDEVFGQLQMNKSQTGSKSD